MVLQDEPQGNNVVQELIQGLSVGPQPARKAKRGRGLVGHGGVLSHQAFGRSEPWPLELRLPCSLYSSEIAGDCLARLPCFADQTLPSTACCPALPSPFSQVVEGVVVGDEHGASVGGCADNSVQLCGYKSPEEGGQIWPAIIQSCTMVRMSDR